MTPSLRVLAVPCLGVLLLIAPAVAHAQRALDQEPLLAVTGVSAAVGRLRVALASETEQGAAVEQALGLLLLGDGAHDAYALTRLADADDASLARGLVVVTALRPDSLATHSVHFWLQ